MTDFRFNGDALQCLVSPDRIMACAAVTFSSTGFDQAGEPFDRPGRATIALNQAGPDAPWRATHIHFSLNMGVPQESFSPKA